MLCAPRQTSLAPFGGRVNNYASGVDRSDVAALARSVGLSDCADAVGDLAQLCLRLTHAPGPSRSGASKLGGLPDLPPGTPWPVFEHDGTHDAFIGQIDLGDADPAIWPGPHDGLLSFFCSIDVETMSVDGGALARVIHVPAGTPLEQRSAPDGLSEELRLKEVPVSLSAELTVPTIAVEPADVLKPLGFDPYADDADDEREDKYMALQDRLEEAQHEVSDAPGGQHQLLGWARHIQGD